MVECLTCCCGFTVDGSTSFLLVVHVPLISRPPPLTVWPIPRLPVYCRQYKICKFLRTSCMHTKCTHISIQWDLRVPRNEATSDGASYTRSPRNEATSDGASYTRSPQNEATSDGASYPGLQGTRLYLQHNVNEWISDAPMKCMWAPALIEVQQYSTLMCLKFARNNG